MTHKIMAICDMEEGYAFRMAEYLLEKIKLPYALHLFTAVEELEKFAGREEIEILLIAESAWRLIKEEYIRAQVAQMFILRESGEPAQTLIPQENSGAAGAEMRCINKYQSPEIVVQEILNVIADGSGWKDCPEATDTAVKMIGIYSPVNDKNPTVEHFR